MAIAWRREPRPRLQTQPWRVITLGTSEKDGEGRKYLVKGLFDDAGYHVMLSDSCAVWEESIEASKVLERLKVELPTHQRCLVSNMIGICGCGLYICHTSIIIIIQYISET